MSSNLQWFRMYHEFASDPKVQMLSEPDQRRYVMLLCLRCSNGSVTLHDDEVAFQLRISNEEWTRTKETLIAKKLIDSDCQPIAWDKRQYVSDSSSKRVAAHRERKKKEAKQACNVTVTPPDTDTDTEEDKENTLVPSADGTSGYSSEFEEFWSAYPKREGNNPKKPALKAWNARLRSGVKAQELILAAKRYAEKSRSDGSYGTKFVKLASTFIGPDDHWREALNSNIHRLPGKEDRPKLKPGQFYHPDWDAGIRQVCESGRHNPETGYLLPGAY